MSQLKPPTALEKVAGSLSTEATLTAISAAIGTPLSALLPVLGKSLAAERQKQRVDAALCEINGILGQHEAQLAHITDQQYKFINEAVLALLHTTNESKMNLLRDVVQNVLSASGLPDQEAVFLSRIIRDISAEEAQFLINNFSYKRIWLSEMTPPDSELHALAVNPTKPEGQTVLGLFTLGIVATAEPTFDDMGLLRFTPMAAKLIVLLKKPNS
ncbi:MAG: hypothetical protein WC696_09430 [Candidatus Methylopumilus sp.]|jgi:hypothetical protein